MAVTAELISKDELTAAKLMELYQHGYFNVSLDPDGEVRLIIDGITMFAIPEPQRTLLRMRIGLNVKPNATRQQVLELCNRVNDGLIFIRASLPAAMAPRLVLILDHYIDTAAGVTGLEVIDETKRVRSVLNSIPPLDTDHILA
jgi:hypothetical protein